KEMLADEITADLRALRAGALRQARRQNGRVTCELESKGIAFGAITAWPDGTVDASQVAGVDEDLRVRPFFAHGGAYSIREFAIGAWNDEMGLQSVDPDTLTASNGGVVATPAGLVLNGALDKIKAPPVLDAQQDADNDGVSNEIPASLVDHMEFYLLNYFKPATHEQDNRTAQGLRLFKRIGCAECHVPDLRLNRDRRVADVETVYDAERGIFNNLFATALPLFNEMRDSQSLPSLKRPRWQPFEVRNIFTDFKRHDLGPNFHERNFDGTLRTLFLTTPLWGVGTTAPYGHDGRSINLLEVILRHGGEAQASRAEFAQLAAPQRRALLDFLQSLVLFPPDDTASNLDPGDRHAPGFPQFKHGGIKLTALFHNPNDVE
ncbi:MAG: di-heme oxidoredictase family protein, partial [Blastocatellia bacterium]